MPICGLVITLDPDETFAANGLRELSRHPRVLVGERVQSRLPIVIDTVTREQDQAMWDWLGGVEGVMRADVVYADLECPCNQEAETMQEAVNE